MFTMLNKWEIFVNQTFILFIYGENETGYKVCKYRNVQAVRRRK